MLGTNFNLLHFVNDQRFSIRTGQAFCWLCQGNWANINCHHCFRYYHHECCLSDGRLATDRLFYRTSDGLQFVSKCNECILIDVIHDRWDKGSEFRKMTPRNIQRLVSLIWSRISCFITANIDFAVRGLSKTWVNCPINFDTIDLRVKNGTYEYPYQMLTDLSLINHNLRLVHQDKFFIDSLVNFMASVYSLFNRCEACPYCLESSFSQRPNWIIETCPWGHPLIFVNLKDQSWPGKLLRYHHHSNLADVLLFGSLEWYQIAASDCRHFVTTDYSLPIASISHRKAVLDSLRYLNNIVYCFPTKITLNSRSVYAEIKDFVVISRDQSTNSSSSSTSTSNSNSSINLDKWTAERVASITHFILNMENQITTTTPFELDRYSQAVMDARQLLLDDSDDEENFVNDVTIDR
ncbi:protein kinase C-binding protein 1-like [Panonychus citri]|uniref:protein kinase C-binding protein 1-like n=1 Tax=Panonychus citri TaxID=50023 RepID=UPI00230804C6|nr:protein kinase C-binding protein 1-like [Panonychus citri]